MDSVEEILREDSALVQTARDLTAGTAGGIAQVLVGQPFDIVKVVRPARCLLYLPGEGRALMGVRSWE